MTTTETTAPAIARPPVDVYVGRASLRIALAAVLPHVSTEDEIPVLAPEKVDAVLAEREETDRG
ncbi:hypothetical protein ACQP60_18850 [Isoptericola variabilis]|uniref:hypothetical protein n=1 Tax=Isoptericola variabilis TaxID=139208 RepID=UPI000AA77762